MDKQTNGRKISLEQAKSYIKNYEDESSFPDVKTRSMLIDRSCVEAILNQDGCNYLRFYLAKTASGNEGQYTLVVVGADGKEKDMITESGGEIYQELGLCPPDCGGGILQA